MRNMARSFGMTVIVALVLSTAGNAATIINTAEVGGTYDGTQQAVKTEFTIDYGDSWALALWLKPDAARMGVAMSMPDASQTGSMRTVNKSGNWGVQVGSANPAMRIQPSSFPVNIGNGQWHHLAYIYTYDSDAETGSATMYLDAQVAGSSPSFVGDVDEIVLLGDPDQSSWLDYYSGQISDYSFYGAADPLTRDDVKDLYDAGIPEPATLSLLAIGGLATLRRRKV